MRRLVVVAGLAAALAACGSSTTATRTTAGTGTPIVFGLSGGNIAQSRVTIQPDGRVRFEGSGPTTRGRVSPDRVQQLRGELQQAHLADRKCPGVLPDVAGRYIRAGGRTVTVHGACVPAFERVWNDLARAVGRPAS